MNVVRSVLGSRVALFLSGIVITATIASLFYLVVNYKYYYTGAGWQIENEAKLVKSAIDAYFISNNDAEETKVRKYISNLIAKDKSYIEVQCLKDGHVLWSEKNDKSKYIDSTRTVVNFEDTISNLGHIYHISIKRGNRPKWYTQLYRAWTFSVADYIMDKQGYVKGRLDYRSWPLVFSVILSALFVTFSLLFYRKIHLDGIKQVSVLQSQLQLLRDHRKKLVTEKNAMSESLSNLEVVSKQLNDENKKLRMIASKAKQFYEENKLLLKNSSELSEKYRELEEKYGYNNNYIAMMNDEIDKLKDQLQYKVKEIEARDIDIVEKETVITDLQKNLLYLPSNTEEVSAQKKIEKVLKTVLPHVKFTKQAVKQIVNDAPTHDVKTLEIMSHLLVALENNYEYEELCKRFNCENMSETHGVYRLKKGDCRVYFFFAPKNVKLSSCYKDAIVEVVELLYKKKKDDISDYVKNCKPSWL